MQKPIDTTKRLNQLLLRASKPLNTLGERKGVHEGGGGGRRRREGSSRDKLLGEEERSRVKQCEREEDDEIEERGECGVKRKGWRDGWRQRGGEL